MTETYRGKQYDLEDRTYEFARRVRAFVKTLPRTICNAEDVKQVVRSSGSVGANYIEANEALGKKDFLMRIRISRKESKETRYWLRLVDTQDDAAVNTERDRLVQESTELMRIFGAILNTVRHEICFCPPPPSSLGGAHDFALMRFQQLFLPPRRGGKGEGCAMSHSAESLLPPNKFGGEPT